MARSAVALAFLPGLLAGTLLAADAPARTPAEWLEIVRRETAEQKRAESPAERSLLLGAALALHPYHGRPDALARLTGRRAANYARFTAWLAQRGEGLVRRLLRGDTLSGEPRRDAFIAHGVVFARYFRSVRKKAREKAALTSAEQAIERLSRAVESRGRELLRKGYLGGSFTQAEVDALRLYAMWVDTRCCGDGVLPFHLGLTERWPSRHPPLGEPAPDFTLLRVEAALRSPAYSDLNPHDPTDVLRPIILAEFLLLMQGYEPAGGSAGRPLVKPRPIVVPRGREADYVTLSSFRGKKPVLLVLANPTDAWTWHWRLAPMFEPLRQAYKHRIEFFFINTTVHDTRMPVRDYFGPDPGRHDAVHDLTLEQRARTCKMFYMTWPHFTTPYLLDDVSQRTRNAYHDQGGGAYVVLVDLDGRVAYADYHQDLPPHWGPDAASFPYEYLTIRMNHLEWRLKSFFEAGCRYAKAVEKPFPQWRKRHQAEGARAPGHTIWLAGRVTGIEAEKRRLVVNRHPLVVEEMRGWRFWQEAGARATPYDPGTKANLDIVRKWLAAGRKGRTYRFAVDDAVDLFLHGEPARLADLRPGDCVGVLYAASQEGRPVIRPRQVRALRAGVGN